MVLGFNVLSASMCCNAQSEMREDGRLELVACVVRRWVNNPILHLDNEIKCVATRVGRRPFSRKLIAAVEAHLGEVSHEGVQP